MVDRCCHTIDVGGFTKLFSTLVTSTIWREDDKTRVVWITMLALSDRYGVVAASVPGLAAMANVEVEDCRRALTRFMAPDPDSRTEEHDGRRIEKIAGGWRLLNYEKYREAGRGEARREYLTRKKRESRGRAKRAKPTGSRRVVAELERREQASAESPDTEGDFR